MQKQDSVSRGEEQKTSQGFSLQEAGKRMWPLKIAGIFVVVTSGFVAAQNEKSYVACLKRGTALLTDRPDWDWLKTDDGRDVLIPGTWTTFDCSYARVTTFLTSDRAYNDVLGRCTKKGYEIAQPAQTLVSAYYAFQVGPNMMEHYSEEVGWVKNGYTRRPQVPTEKC